jgi:nodulation protein E
VARRVAITGMGCVSALGQGLEPSWAAVEAGVGGIRHLAKSYGDHPGLNFEGPAAFVEKLDTHRVEARFGTRAMANLDPVSAFAIVSAFEALEDAGLLGEPVLAERTAVLFGAGSGGNATLEEGFARIYDKKAGSIHPMSIPKMMVSAPVSHLSMIFGIRGLAFTVSSACASSAHAIAEAMHMIRAGRCDVALVGGGEAALTLGSWLGWTALRAMAHDTCRPFSIDRKGMVLGEGAAMIVLESFEHAEKRGAAVHAELAGAGASSDAYHLTMPQGEGAERALREAHADAGIALDTPVLVSSHGTGTPLNDKTEAGALNAVYGEAMRRNLVIATKSAHGHLIGGAGALELVLGIAALKRRTAPPILNYLGPDPECGVPLALERRDIDYDVLVSNSFAFGGLNSVLIARRV